MVRFLGTLLCAFAFVVAAVPASAQPANATRAPARLLRYAVAGSVIDATTGLPVAGATVRVTPAAAGDCGDAPGLTKCDESSVATDNSGRFSLRAIVVRGRLRVERSGYEATETETLEFSAGIADLKVSVQAVSAASLRTIAVTSTRGSSTLQKSGTFYRTLSPEALIESGVLRAGDALRQLPEINNGINGDTAALGDDLNLSIRGYGNGNTKTGQIETISTLDGHPIAFGSPGGYNYQLSPTFGLRNITVYYGSAGTGLTGYDAIGGLIDSQTIEPTREQRVTLDGGVGTFGRTLENVTATGTSGKLGYAFSLGTATVDGPFNNEHFYQPGAAYDPSATSAPVRDLAVYRDDATTVSRSGVFKIRYALSSATRVTLTGVESSYWEDKTGNGDGDFLTPTVALAQGNNLLAKKSSTDPCPKGQFSALNPAGTYWGTGPGGVADGGSRCQTPASYAHNLTGLQGAGPSWQSFNFNDEALHVESNGSRHTLHFDAFGNRYLDTNDHTFELPFKAVPGDVASWTNNASASAGYIASDDLTGRNNSFGFGYRYTNFAYGVRRNGTLRGAPIVNETDAFVREAYRPQNSPLSIYASADFKHATTTNTAYADPRVSVVYTLPGARDVIRAAAGATSAQPAANLLDQVFTPSNLVTAGGGGGINCATVNGIGTAPSALLRPERGVDTEVAYGHRFNADSQSELTFYNTNVFDKIYSTTTPLSVTGTSFIDPAALASVESLLAAKCGGNPLALLGVTGFVNIGQLRAQGFTLTGRQRISPGTFFDYDYATTSTVVKSATPLFFQQNLTIIQNAQLPRLPLHTFDIAVDGAVTPRFDVRYTLHYVGENNTKRLTAYNYSELRLSASRIATGTFSASVFNLFDQNAFIEGLLGQGQPLALNQYATKAQYAPYIGAGETEQFGLPYRSVFFNYALPIGAGR